MRASRLNLLSTLFLIGLVSCGGGGAGGGGTPSPTATTTVLSNQIYVGIVAAMNDTDSRVPAGFYTLDHNDDVEHEYFHVRSSDVNPAATAVYDVANADPYQAQNWANSTVARRYNSLTKLSSSETPWYYETTSYSNDPAIDHPHLISARVFKSNAIDRSVYDSRNPGALQAVIQHRPITAMDVSFISEYLWTYSSSNNAGHVVVDSATQQTTSGYSHRINEAVFQPAMSSGQCSTVQLWSLQYDVNSVNGGVTLNRSLQDEFQVTLNATGGYTLCLEQAAQTATTDQGRLVIYPE